MARLGKVTDGPVSRLVNRRVSTRVTRLVYRLGVRDPNKVTVAVAVLGLLAPLPYLLIDPWLAALAGVLIQLASILDGVDGEIARLTGRTSRRGAFLDAMVDRFVDIVSFTLACYATSAALGLGSSSALLTGFVVSADLMVSYLHARGEASLGKSPILIGKLRPWASRDVRLFGLAVSSILVPFLGWWALLAGLVLLALLSYAYVIAKMVEVFVATGVEQ